MQDTSYERTLTGDYIPPEFNQENPTFGALAKLLENPSQVKGLLSLSNTQVRNVKALIAGIGAAASSKTLSRYFGDELAAVAGAAISAYVAKRLLG